MFEFTCPECGASMHSAYNYPHEQHMLCIKCGSPFANPHRDNQEEG